VTVEVLVDSNVLIDVLARDARRYRSYFPRLALVAPGDGD